MKRFIAATTLSLLASGAMADPIAGLVNTGTGLAGSVETAYTLTVESGTTVLSNTHPYVTGNGIWPIDPWIANSASSKWLMPTALQGETFDPSVDGVYHFTLRFDLSGTNPNSASFSARFSADNAAAVMLNGEQIATGVGYTQWSSFAASAGFVPGINTLDFVVTNDAQNGGNPFGLRVEFLSSNVNAVPEPGSLTMLLAGLGMLGMVGRRRR